jgi:hypothetical protein
MSFQSAISVLSNNSIGFSCLEDFNDPFECTSFGFMDHDEILTSTVANNAFKNNFSRKFGVLSLTRQPLNSLMWSHYGDSHRGVVIGFDVSLCGFGETKDNVIPFQYGDIIYTGTKPHKDNKIPEPNVVAEIRYHNSFEIDKFDLLKKAFLYKSLEWAYEEEVRVVKNISDLPFSYHFGEGTHGDWTQIKVAGRALYCFNIPPESIKEVYLGKNIYHNYSKGESVSREELKAKTDEWKSCDYQVYICHASLETWNLRCTKANSI